MTAHLHQILWSLRVLWRVKGIVWPFDRLRLWKKTIHLYMSFLAFTDVIRPADQLRRAMICAILSAVYDYDSDWNHGARNGANFLALLNQYVESEKARTFAARLFLEDVAKDLSTDGLERGSGALYFYWLVIDSAWMRRYSKDEIMSFGQKLQIIDDLLDLDHDHLADDQNCLLQKDRAQAYADEAREFLTSKFFVLLQANSHVYRSIGRMATKTLRRFGSDQATFSQLLRAGRPMTAGLFGFVLPLISFGFWNEAPWLTRFIVAFCFMGLTMSIMIFNDWRDRRHDRRKGKFLASENEQEFWSFWVQLSMATSLLLLLVVIIDPLTAAFCAGVWLIGLVYSLFPQLYLIQNLTVALLAGSPALVGAVYHRSLGRDSILTFLVFASILMIGEILKDIEDARIDRGYKATIPTTRGHPAAVSALIGLVFMAAAWMIFHPHPWVPIIAIVGMPILGFGIASMMLVKYRTQVTRVKSTMKLIIACLLLALLLI